MSRGHWNRRRVLAGMLTGAIATALGSVATAAGPSNPRIGLALGSGGARGLAHIQVIEVFDKLGLRPHRIAGSSIGAIVGALYASGLSAADLHEIIDSLTKEHDESWFEALLARDLTRWMQFIEPGAERGGIARSDAFIRFLRDKAGVTRFDELTVPLRVVATDFWSRDMVVFETGDLWPAVQASMAVPGLFEPIRHRDRVLVDGGLTNPVPFDLLENCDLIVAVDVLGSRTPETPDALPSSMDSLFNTFQIMQSSILTEKLKRMQPDIVVRPDIQDIRVLDFYRFEEIFKQGLPARDAFESELRQRVMPAKTSASRNLFKRTTLSTPS